MWIKAGGEKETWKREAYYRKWVVETVGEATELGCRNTCGQKGGWSTGETGDADCSRFLL